MNSVDYIKQAPLKTFERGEVLLQKGDTSKTLMVIRNGFIKVTSINDDGVERLVWLPGRYDIAPTERLFSRSGTVRFFYTALTDGSYYEVDKETFMAQAAKTPELMEEIARGMSDHYDELLQRVDAIDSASVRDRLLRTLLQLAEHLSADEKVDLYTHGLVLTHADFANLIGSTRETTSLTLNSLRKEGYLDYSRGHFTIDCEKIRTLFDT